MHFSLLFNLAIDSLKSFLSISSSILLEVTSLSVPKTSESNNSFPSQSWFSGSSIDTSLFSLLLLLRCIKISFSIHLEAYVANFIFLSTLKVLTPFINPIVPIEIKSSKPTPVFSNFLAIYTTNLKFLSTKTLRASFSPFSILSNISCSSSGVNGGGNVWLPPI